MIPISGRLNRHLIYKTPAIAVGLFLPYRYVHFQLLEVYTILDVSDFTGFPLLDGKLIT